MPDSKATEFLSGELLEIEQQLVPLRCEAVQEQTAEPATGAGIARRRAVW